MRIAIHNSFLGQKFAETELVRRIIIAAQNLGWEAIEIEVAQEIDLYKPDFVLVTHFNTLKLSQFPTYGCMWNPPVFFDRYEEFTREYNNFDKITEKHANIFSYDAYLSSSTKFDDWLIKQTEQTAKKYFIAPFFTSSNQSDYIPPNLEEPQLVYIGSNWDGSRFKKLFKKLHTYDFMQVYGSKWDYLKKSYKGSLPFDGISVLNTLRNAGVGLCLHRPEHREAEMPSMRIFEIVASGAIAICSEHQFIRDAFENSVLYIDAGINPLEQAKQIVRHMEWIRNHPQEALKMSKQAHDIFLEKYTLEKLMLGIIPHHQQLIKDKGFVKDTINIQSPQSQVEFIVRVGDRPLTMLRRCLDSIVNQTYKNIGVILVKYKNIKGLDELINFYQETIDIQIIESNYTGFRSTQIKDGIKAVRAKYFGILDDDDILYPNHVYTLVSMLDQTSSIGVAYSGAIKVWETSTDLEVIEKQLTYFHDFDIRKIAKFQNFITSNSFIARSYLLQDVYQEDPYLETTEDFCLILELCSKTLFSFSYEITCEFYWRKHPEDNVSLTESDSSDRLWEIFKDKQLLYAESCGVNQELVTKYSFYQLLRRFYLRFSKGGKFNKSPNFIGKLLIFLKELILE